MCKRESLAVLSVAAIGRDGIGVVALHCYWAFIVKISVKEVLWKKDKKNTATCGSFSNLLITVFTYYMRLVTCFIGGVHNSQGTAEAQ